jgi:predicted dehydrogenase
MKLRIGFIGVGAMGLSHLKSMHVACGKDAEAVAIQATNPKNIELALAIAPKAKVFKSEDELIQSPLSAIFVSTPNFAHVRLAHEVLRAGKDLFLEKPCGITQEECDTLLRVAEKTDRIVMIGHELRYSPYFQKIKALIDAGEIGRPRMVWCREFRGPMRKKSQDWIQDERRSGGGLVDKNCHHFDLMNWWVSARPKRVVAFGSCAVNRVIEGPHQVLDHATVSFEYENEVRGTLQLCMFARDFPGEDLELGVVGDAGMLQTRISEIQILQWKRGEQQKEPIIHNIAAKRGEGWGNHLGHDEIHEAFVACVRERHQPFTSVQACLDGTRLAIAAEESIKAGKLIEIA